MHSEPLLLSAYSTFQKTDYSSSSNIIKHIVSFSKDRRPTVLTFSCYKESSAFTIHSLHLTEMKTWYVKSNPLFQQRFPTNVHFNLWKNDDLQFRLVHPLLVPNVPPKFLSYTIRQTIGNYTRALFYVQLYQLNISN